MYIYIQFVYILYTVVYTVLMHNALSYLQQEK